MLKQQKGITLLTLVFAIIAMLALAAVAIAMVLDELSYNPEPEQIKSEQQVISTDDANLNTPVPETPVANTPETTDNQPQ